MYNVPYISTYNYIKYVFNVLKMCLRQHTFNNTNQLDELLKKFKVNTSIEGVTNYYNKAILNLFNNS
jgi:hypothetical protein